MSKKKVNGKPITDIVNMVQKHVEGVTGVEKNKGVNIWLISVKDGQPNIAAIELKAIGFKIHGVNEKTHLIVASYEGVEGKV